MQRIRGNTPLALPSFLLLIVLLLSAQVVSAQQVPPFGGDIYIQTSGPNTPLNIGDYYTSSGGEPNPAERLHHVDIFVPCAWPSGVPVTFAAFDPESSGGSTTENIGAGLPATADEKRGVYDNTRFRVLSPTNTILSDQTFIPTGGAHQHWVELVTFDPSVTGCGKYTIESTTSDNDDNSWVLRAGHDPDCTTSGSCSGISATASGYLGDGDITNDLDSVPGTGDEIFLGFTRISYQHNATSCQTFHFFIDYTRVGQEIRLNNFDMDSTGPADTTRTITYNLPDGSSVSGTASGGTVWNGSSNTTRVGDPFTITDATVGWWSAEICINNNNQYIFEGLEGEDVFIEPVPEPLMTVVKDDGRTEVSASGEEVTYVIDYANIGPGAAANVEIVDTLPPGATFVSCTDGCTNSGSTVTWTLPLVVAGGSGSVSVTTLLPPAPSGSTHTNTVTLSYEDLVGHPFPDVTDDDVDLVVLIPATPTLTPVVFPFTPSGPGTQTPPNTSINKTVNPPFAGPGETVTWTITAGNPGPQTLTNVRVVDTLPAQFEVLSVSTTLGTGSVNGQTVTVDIPTLAVNANAVITVRSRIRASAQPPYLLENNACMTSAQVSAAACAKATVSSAAGLPATGESPWSALRMPMLLGAGLLLVTAFALLKRPTRRA